MPAAYAFKGIAQSAVSSAILPAHTKTQGGTGLLLKILVPLTLWDAVCHNGASAAVFPGAQAFPL